MLLVVGFPLWIDNGELAQTEFSGNTRMDVIQATHVSHMNWHPWCIMMWLRLKNQGDNLVSVPFYKSKSPGCNQCPKCQGKQSQFKACVPVDELWTFSFSASAAHAAGPWALVASSTSYAFLRRIYSTYVVTKWACRVWVTCKALRNECVILGMACSAPWRVSAHPLSSLPANGPGLCSNSWPCAVHQKMITNVSS